MYACILDQHGEMRPHRHMPASPETLLKAMAPYREDMVVAVECVFTWYWLTSLRPTGSACVLGHALYMNAIHGGKAKNDPIDAQNMAVLLPQAYVYPAATRATRALLRRRVQLTRTRAALLAHVQYTNSQYHRLEIGQPLAYQANRNGGAERCADDRTASENAEEHLGALALIPWPLIGHPFRLLRYGQPRAQSMCPAPSRTWHALAHAALTHPCAWAGRRARIGF